SSSSSSSSASSSSSSSSASSSSSGGAGGGTTASTGGGGGSMGSEICDNGADDDGDGHVDCDDTDCAADCPPTTWVCDPAFYDEEPANEYCDCECGAPDPDCTNPAAPVENCSAGEKCDANGLCVPATGEICGNTMDDDGDGLTDCFDMGCLGQPG